MVTASVVAHLARAVWQKWWAEWQRLQALAGCASQRSELRSACDGGRRAQPRFSARSVRRAGGPFVNAASSVRATADSRRASARGAASERRRGSRSKVVVHRVLEFSAGRRRRDAASMAIHSKDDLYRVELAVQSGAFAPFPTWFVYSCVAAAIAQSSRADAAGLLCIAAICNALD